MTSKKRRARGHRPERRISVRGVLRDEINLRKLGRVALAEAAAQAQAEAEARAEDEARQAASRASDGVTFKRDSDVPKEAA